MKYAILKAGVPVQWCNDDTVLELPSGAVALSDAEWESRHATPYQPTLTEAKQSKLADLSVSCQAQIYAGFDSSALGAVHHYPAKDRDQSNLAGSVLASLLPGVANDWTTPFWCADADDNWSFADHTAEQIQQVGRDAKVAILTALAKNAQLAEQINAIALDDPDFQTKIAAITWPA
jgi:hypothetical protein